MPDLLSCPSCRHPLLRETESLRCSCSRFPVVEGIPIITGWARNRSLTTEQVLARHLPPPHSLVGKLFRRLFPQARRMRTALEDRDATFLDLAEDLGRVADLDYFLYRFSDLSYLTSAALLTPLANGPVLDLGCGAGHLLRALAARFPKGLIVGVDLNFNLLYLARRFLVPQALLVCADASLPLPFFDGAFEASVCTDVFQYLPDPALSAAELLRVTRGPIVLSHLWTPSSRSPGGFPPERYRAFFSARKAALHDESRLIERFLRTRSLDLTPADVVPGEAMSMTIGVEEKVHAGGDYFLTGSVLNPIYEIEERGDSLHLRRRFISDGYSETYNKYKEYFPESLTVTKEQIASHDPELVRKFVLLDLPPLYC
jgi:SAM-dependent methyltransferase